MRMTNSVLSLLLLTLGGFQAFSAEGDLAVWATGPGMIADAPATVGTGVTPGVVVRSGDAPVRLTLVKAPKSSLILAPDSSLVLTEKDDGFLVQLQTGIVQANIVDKGSYANLRVQGAALDVQVTGTLFMVQRMKADTDYVSLIEGRVKVSLRQEVALALGRASQTVELNSRQGLGAGVGGFGGIEALAARPQIPTTSVAMRTASIRVAGIPAPGGGNWNQDTGLTTTAPPATTPVTTPTTPTPSAPVTPTVAPVPAVIPTTQIQENVTEQVRTAVSTAVTTDVTQGVTNNIKTEVINQVVGTIQPLGKPPGPPDKK